MGDIDKFIFADKFLEFPLFLHLWAINLMKMR